MSLPRFALQHKAIVLAAAALAVTWGAFRFVTLSRSEDPEFSPIWATVVTSWPGATAEDIENLVTDPIEEAVSDLDEVSKVASLNTIGRSVVNVTLLEGTRDTDAAWAKVRAQVRQVRLPEGASGPHIDTTFSDTAAMVLALYQQVPEGGERFRYTPRQMEVYAERLKDELLLVEAISRVELYGVQREAIYLETNAGTWGQLGLTTVQLQNLLQQRNIISPGGSINTDSVQFSVKPTGRFSAVEELNQVIVPSQPSGTPSGQADAYGTPIYLEDLGLHVVRDYEDPPSLLARVTAPGKAQLEPCVVLSFMMKDGYNIVELGEEVRERIRHAGATLIPADLEVEVVGNQPEIVQQKVGSFVDNLWQAILIVIVVAFIMVGLRAAMVMAASIPLVMVVSIGVTSFFGVHIEIVSLAALIISLGMLVDCAIEVADNVHHHLHHGSSRYEAAVEGTQQIAFPVLIGTLTTVGAFLPMLMVPGTTGEYIYSLPVVVSATLLISWLLAMTVTALLAYWLIRPVQRRPPLVWLSDVVRARLRRRRHEPKSESGGLYDTLCWFSLRHKWISIGLPVAICIGTIWLFATGRIGTQFFPASDRAQFVLDVHLPEGTPIGRTDRVCRAAEEMIHQLADDGTPQGRVRNMISYVGQGGPRFYGTLDPMPPSSSYAQIVINTHSREQVVPLIQEIRRAARAGVPAQGIAPIPDARLVPRKLDMGPPVDAPIELLIFGRDSNQLRRHADRLKAALRRVPGTIDVRDSWGNPGYQLTVDIHTDKSNVAGVSNYSIARTLNAYYSGHPLTTFREGDHQVPVYLRLPSAERAALPDAGRMFMEGERGKVPLASVADIRYEHKPVKIRRENRSRVIEVLARVEEGELANTVLDRAMPAIRSIAEDLPAGYRLEIGGEKAETIKGQKATLVSSGVSIGVILLLLVINYNSLAKPPIILLTLPLAAAGSLLGLYLTGQPLGFMAGLGLLSLIGIVINDGIVLVKFIELLIGEKLEKGEGRAGSGEKSYAGLTREAFHEAIVRGGRLRLLPISLTTLTTAGGLLPLAFAGGPLFEPLAIVLIFGLLLGVGVMLLTLPAIYAAFVEYLRIEVFPGREPETSS